MKIIMENSALKCSPGVPNFETETSSIRNTRVTRPGPASGKLRNRAEMAEEGASCRKRRRLEETSDSPANAWRNPLIIPEIVAYLMKFMKLPELTQSRLVSKLWSTESKRDILLHHPLKINSKNCAKLQDFLELIQSTTWSKSRRLKFTLDFPFRQHVKELDEIFKVHGPGLTQLTIEAYFIHKSNVDLVRDTLLGHLENIESLELNIPVTFLQEPLKMFPTVPFKIWEQLTKLEINLFIGSQGQNIGFAEDLFRRMPNLETLILAPFTELYIDWVASMTLASVLEVLCDVCPAHLKNLSLKFKVPESTIVKLLSAEFQLNSLYITNLSSFTLNFKSNGQNEIQSTGSTYAGVPSEILLGKLQTVLVDNRTSPNQEVNCLQFLRIFQSTLAGVVHVYNPNQHRIDNIEDIQNL